ncbi:MAG: hypothetical protein ABI480_04980 [Chitinophagaceae bacterium]
MKYIFILAAFGIFTTAAAQDNSYKDLMKKLQQPQSELQLKKLPRFDAISKQFNSFTYKSMNPNSTLLLSKLANGTKVYALPMDRMPCLVPDMNQFNMPNVGQHTMILKFPEPGYIPNPQKGLIIIPGKRIPPTD